MTSKADTVSSGSTFFGIGGDFTSSGAPGSQGAMRPAYTADSTDPGSRNPFGSTQAAGTYDPAMQSYQSSELLPEVGSYISTGAGLGATHDVHKDAEDGGNG